MVRRLISPDSASAPNTMGKMALMFTVRAKISVDHGRLLKFSRSWDATAELLIWSSTAPIRALPPMLHGAASATVGISSAHHILTVRILRNSAEMSRPIRRYLPNRHPAAARAAGPPAAGPAAAR